MSETPEKAQRRAATEQIAAALDETKHSAIRTIARMIFHLGEDRTRQFLEQALEVEANGGMMTTDGDRRRSVGGVFFKRVKDSLTPRERGRIFGPASPEAREKRKKQAKAKRQPPTWERLLPVVEAALAEQTPGEAKTVKLTLIGRPGKIIEKKATVLTTMQSSKAPSLPKGLPPLPNKPTVYLVFIAKKQWRKVHEAIESDPQDRLIVEGYPVFDPRIGGGTMCLYAQMVTTTALQRARREAQQNA